MTTTAPAKEPWVLLGDTERDEARLVDDEPVRTLPTDRAGDMVDLPQGGAE